MRIFLNPFLSTGFSDGVPSGSEKKITWHWQMGDALFDWALSLAGCLALFFG